MVAAIVSMLFVLLRVPISVGVAAVCRYCLSRLQLSSLSIISIIIHNFLIHKKCYFIFITDIIAPITKRIFFIRRATRLFQSFPPFFKTVPRPIELASANRSSPPESLFELRAIHPSPTNESNSHTARILPGAPLTFHPTSFISRVRPLPPFSGLRNNRNHFFLPSTMCLIGPSSL